MKTIVLYTIFAHPCKGKTTLIEKMLKIIAENREYKVLPCGEMTEANALKCERDVQRCITKLELSSTDDRTARLSRKYPAWVWGNYALLFILAVTSLMYFVDYSNSGGWLINLFRNYSVWAFVAGMVLIILLFGLWAMNILGLGIFKDKKSKIKKL